MAARPLRVRRILVVRRGSLGDLVVCMPTLAALRARYPHAHITLGVHARFSAGALRLFAAGYDLVLSGVWYCLIPEASFAGAAPAPPP